MITSQGYGLIAELIAIGLLIAALTGYFVQRSKPWLVGDGIRDTHSSRECGHRFIDLATRSSPKKEAPAAASGTQPSNCRLLN